MPRVAVSPSPAVADFLRARRKKLGWTLREVGHRAAAAGDPIPFTTLGKIESGAVDPGVKRLHALLRLYGLPIQAAGDLLELEAMADAVPIERDPLELREMATRAWHEGQTGRAIACFLAFRKATAEDPAHKPMRHDAILWFAVIAGKLGKHHLSRQMLDEMLTESPDRSQRVNIMIQQASSWNALGAPEASLAYLGRAWELLSPTSHLERGWVLHQRASIQIDLREFDEAESNLKSAIQAFRKVRRPYDEAMSLSALARLYLERGDARKATADARRAFEFASRHRFARIRMFAAIHHGRAHLLAGAPQAALGILGAVLADAVRAQDNVGRFHAHFYLWKSYSALQETSQAENERRDAVYYLQFVDQSGPEAIELRGAPR